MQIVDQYGNPTTSGLQSPATYSHGADQWSRARPWQPTRLGDIDMLIPPTDRRTLVSVSRSMVENWGPVRAIARQIPLFAVGNAWKPSNKSTDASYRETTETLIRDLFWPVAAINTPSPDMGSVIKHLIHMLVRDGEYFVLLTKRKSGFPAIQVVPTHRVGQRSGQGATVESGRYKGLPIEDGVICNWSGQIVAYRILGRVPKDDRDVSARSVIHRVFSDYVEGKRGFPAISHGLNDARDSLQSHEWERFNLLFRSSRTIIEHNESGTNEHPSNYFGEAENGSTGVPGGPKVQTLQGGTTQFFKAGTGGKLEVLEHKNPGDIYESYGNRMIRSICAGTPWPFSFVWEGHTRGGGTSERRDIEQARWMIEGVQSVVDRDVARIYGYAVSVFAQLDEAPAGEDWWRWTSTKPKKLSIDEGRTVKSLLDLHARGLMSDDRMLEELGEGDPDDYWTRKFDSAARKEKAFVEAQERHDVLLDPRIKGVISVNEQNPEPTYDPNPLDQPEKDPAVDPNELDEEQA